MSILSSALTGGMSSLVMPVAIGGLGLSLLAGGALWYHEHNLRVAEAAVAQVASEQAAVVAKAQREQDARTIAGLSLAAQKAAALAATMTKLKEAINNAPKTSTCVSSPSIVALLAGLRSGAIGGHADPAGAPAGVNVAMPGPAAPAGR